MDSKNTKPSYQKPQISINEKGEKIIKGATKQLTVTSTPPIAIKNGRERTAPNNSSKAGSPLRQHAVAKYSKQGSGSFNSRINIVTETCSFIPSAIASSFSLEVAKSPPPLRRQSTSKKLGDLGEAAQVSTSCQENLDQSEILDDPNYTDTIQSTDSAASLLRRTFSLPADYHFTKKKSKHVNEIFADFYLQNEGPTFYQSTESTYSGDGKTRDLSAFRQTMEDLLEKPEYIDSLESSSSRKALLAKAALSYAKERLPVWPEDDEISIDEFQIKAEKRRFMKNLIILTLCYMMLFIAVLSMRNLQSSINNDMGLISLCFLYASLFVSCIFTTTVVQRLRPRNTMLICFAGFIIYVACNFYPHYYTLLPASAIAGFAMANSYTAQATYLTNIAVNYAAISGKSFPLVLTRFNGLFYMGFQAAQIIGGVLSSVILTFGNSPGVDTILGSDKELNGTEVVNLNESDVFLYSNTTFESTEIDILSTNFEPKCGADFCPIAIAEGQTSSLKAATLYILVGILTLSGICAITLLFLCLDPLEGEMKKTQSSLYKQITACFRFLLDVKVVCLLPLMFYSLLQVSFMFGEYSKAFVTCSSGVHMVGLVMLTISSFCAVSSFINMKIAKYINRRILIPIGYSIHISLYLVMLVWSPTADTVYALFIVAAIWGVADGIFVTQVITLFGVLFIHNKEPAFAALKMCQALAVCIFFFVSPYVCTRVKVMAMIVIAVLAATGYLAMELIIHREQQAKQQAEEVPQKKVPKGPTSV